MGGAVGEREAVAGGIVLPKGAVENNETHKQAAVRETKEEAGVVGDVAQG